MSNDRSTAEIVADMKTRSAPMPGSSSPHLISCHPRETDEPHTGIDRRERI